MHNAPSVSYPLGRSRCAGALLLFVWVLAAVSCSAWWRSMPAAGWRIAAGAAVLFATGLLAGWQWWRSPAGTLVWDQEHWIWSVGGQHRPGVPEVRLDLQRWVLLRWRTGGSSHWFWLERASRPELWADLRRAVYSRARTDALPKAGPSAAKP